MILKIFKKDLFLRTFLNEESDMSIEFFSAHKWSITRDNMQRNKYNNSWIVHEYIRGKRIQYSSKYMEKNRCTEYLTWFYQKDHIFFPRLKFYKILLDACINNNFIVPIFH